MSGKHCRRCFGLLAINKDGSSIESLRCLNCGHREYPTPQVEHRHEPAGKTTQKKRPGIKPEFPILRSETDKRGKVTTTADFLLDGQQHKIELSVSRKSLLALGGLDRTRLENMLGNVFAYPLAHQIVRDKSLHGRHADSNRRQFMATAREIEKMLSAWLSAAPSSDRVLKRAIKVIENGKGYSRNQNDRVIVFLIERNWLNIKRKFPDKKPTQIPQFLRNLRKLPVGTMADAYALSIGYLGSRLDKAVYPIGRNQLDIKQRGRLLASGILGGEWYLRQITNVCLTPSI